MQVQLTNAGAALIEANTGPVVVDSFKLGTDYNYVPDPTDVNIRGTLVFTGTPSAPRAVTANIVRYSAYLDYPTGPFTYGEIGLFVGTTLFALASSQTLIEKIATAGILTGNSIRMDLYLSMVGQNYDMWLDLAESDNGFRAAVIGSVDQLPSPQQATPNLYIVSGLNTQQSAFFAYTDRTGRWNFDAYEYADATIVPITSFDSQSVNIALSDYVDQMHPDYLGKIIVEFVSGALFGVCRYVSSAVISGNSVTLGFDNPLMIEPIVGDEIVVYVRQSTSTTVPNIPPATTSVIGGIIVGASLTVSPQGLLDVNYGAIPYPVTTVAGRTGNIVLTAADIGGLAAVATSGNYNDLFNKPTPYTLPVATTSVLGGVKAPSNGSITIAGDGTLGLGSSLVTSVAGRAGAVVLTYVDISGLATVANTGNYEDLSNKPTPYTLPVATASVLGGVKQGTGITIAGDGTISSTGDYTLPVATTAQLGGVKQGTNVTIAGDGTLSVAAPYALPVATASVLGGIKQGVGVSIAGDGTISSTYAYTLPVATASVLGGVKQGTNVTIAGDGTISVASSPVTSVSGQTGVVVVQATDSSTASGTSLIANSGASTGNIKLLRVVNGTNISIVADGNGNLVINNTQAASPVTSVSGQTGAVVIQASDSNTATGTSLIANGGSTTGNVKLLRVVAGTNIAIAPDGSGNLVFSSTVATGVTTFNTRNGAVTLTSTDISGASGALLSDVAASKYYDMTGGASGAIGVSQILMQYPAVRTLTVGSLMVGSKGYATAPTATVTLQVNVLTPGGSSTNVGTIVWAAAALTPTFTGAGFTVSPGQVVIVTAPASADATFANATFTILALAT